MSQLYRAVVSDLDGTLLNAHHQIGHFTAETLEKLASTGVDVFLATGRNYPDVKQIIRKLNVENITLITSNGARANNLAGETLATHYLPESTALRLFQVPFDPARVCLNSYQGDDWFINVDVPQLRQYHQDSGYMYQVIDFRQQHGKQAEKIFYIGKTLDDLAPIEQYIRANFDDVQIAYSSPQCLEIMAKGVCKAETLAKLVAARGYTLRDCLAFGDGMNDIEMLSQVGKGCLMQNADPRLVEKLPHNERIGHHSHEAVASYLRATFGII